MSSSPRNALVLLHDGVRSLDATGSGLTPVPDGEPASIRPGPRTTVLVPGGRFTGDFEPRLTDWLRTHGGGAQRLVPVCTGGLLPAEAGRPDGRHAGTR